jgi:hypothetical protein
VQSVAGTHAHVEVLLHCKNGSTVVVKSLSTAQREFPKQFTVKLSHALFAPHVTFVQTVPSSLITSMCMSSQAFAVSQLKKLFAASPRTVISAPEHASAPLQVRFDMLDPELAITVTLVHACPVAQVMSQCPAQ